MSVLRNKTIGGVVQALDYEEPIVLRTPSGYTEPEPIIPGIPAEIGEIVLFSIGPNVFRPFLVVSLGTQGKISGMLFLAGDQDKGAQWVRKYAFRPPTKELPYLFLSDVFYGDSLGQWRRK